MSEIYPWGDTRRFNSYSRYFRELFGSRIQKVTVNAGFTCPNRDGTSGTGGCTFCNNKAFTPSYCMKGNSISWQITEGIDFHASRYRKAEKYLAYFQSFSNTYGKLEDLKRVYNQALSLPEIAGLVIGTRPDCIDREKLEFFREIASEKYVTIEYGIESCYDSTLKRINRGHDFRCASEAVKMTAEYGLSCGAHFILGLPGESDEMLLEQIQTINKLPLTTIKFHQLQIFKDTEMEKDYRENPESYRFWSLPEYIDLFIEILRRLKPEIVLERFASEAPPRYHVGENWGLARNEQLLTMLEKRLAEKNVWQGELYKP